MSISVEYADTITQEDVASLAMNLREMEKQDVLRSFESVADGILSAWMMSEHARVIRVSGHPVAAYGVARFGDDIGVPWMLCTDLLSYASPIRIVREARAKLKEIVMIYPVMTNTVPAEDEEAQSLLESLGFEFTDNFVTRDDHEYRQFWYGRNG